MVREVEKTSLILEVKGVGEVAGIDFDELYQLYANRLTLIAYSVTKDWQIAEDVVQEAFVKAYRKIDTIDDERKIKAWLSTITMRTAIDFFRSEKRKRWVPVDLSIVDPTCFVDEIEWVTDVKVEENLFKEEMNRLIDCLSADYQEVLLLKMQYGLKENEIAQLLQLKSSTVKTRLYRARKKLKQVIEEKYPA